MLCLKLFQNNYSSPNVHNNVLTHAHMHMQAHHTQLHIHARMHAHACMHMHTSHTQSIFAFISDPCIMKITFEIQAIYMY